MATDHPRAPHETAGDDGWIPPPPVSQPPAAYGPPPASNPSAVPRPGTDPWAPAPPGSLTRARVTLAVAVIGCVVVVAGTLVATVALIGRSGDGPEAEAEAVPVAPAAEGESTEVRVAMDDVLDLLRADGWEASSVIPVNTAVDGVLFCQPGGDAWDGRAAAFRHPSRERFDLNVTIVAHRTTAGADTALISIGSDAWRECVAEESEPMEVGEPRRLPDDPAAPGVHHEVDAVLPGGRPETLLHLNVAAGALRAEVLACACGDPEAALRLARDVAAVLAEAQGLPVPR